MLSNIDIGKGKPRGTDTSACIQKLMHTYYKVKHASPHAMNVK